MAIIKQLRRTPPRSPKPEDDPYARERRITSASTSSSTSPTSTISKKDANKFAPWKDPQVFPLNQNLELSDNLPQAFEVLRAVERKDIM